MTKNLVALSLICYLLTTLSFPAFSQLPNSWTQKNNFGGSNRFGAASFSIGTKGYLGTGNAGAKSNDLWEYDPATESWSQKANFGGTARAYATGFSIAGKGYIACGDDGIYKNDFWEYNPGTNTWIQKADFAGPPRIGAVGFSLGSKGYLGSGLLVFSPVLRTNDFWEYDPTTDVWTQKSNIGTFVRAFGVGFSIGNKGYIGTGNNGSILTKDFWEYNPATDAWVRKADFGGSGRFQAVGIGTDTYGYIGLGDIGGGYTNDFWEYSPTLDTWTKKTNFGGQIRTLAAGLSISNTVYVGTGYDAINSIRYNDFWKYTPTCTFPSIASEPGNQSITYGDAAQFTVVATDVIAYQWQENAGSGFTDITDGGIYSNAKTPTLTLSLPEIVMTGFKYRSVLTGNCLTTISTTGNATLTLLTVSTKELSAESFDIYPNPCNGRMNIKLKTANKEQFNIEIFNNLGTLIWKQNDVLFDDNNIKIVTLDTPTSGLYTVVLRNKKNSFAKKLFITK
jgi:hypothetical protein